MKPILARLASILGLLFAVVALNFILIQFAPGDPVEVMINDRLVARGDLVKLPGNRLGVSLTEIVKDYVSEK